MKKSKAKSNPTFLTTNSATTVKIPKKILSRIMQPSHGRNIDWYKIKDIMTLSLSGVIFALFLGFSLFLFLYDFEQSEIANNFLTQLDALFKVTPGSLTNAIGYNAIFRVFGGYFAISACNYIGYWGNSNRIEHYEWTSRFVRVVYWALLAAVLYFSWNADGMSRLAEWIFRDEAILSFILFSYPIAPGLGTLPAFLWIALVVYAVMSMVGFRLSKIYFEDWGCFFLFIFSPILAPIAAVILCVLLILKMIGKFINLSERSGGSSGSSKTAYTYTNSSGCSSTVYSDDGKDFTDSSGAHVGISDDGGNTIIED